MGVCGCGKSTLGRALSELSGLRYLDGDDLHPAANVAKMQSGVPLNDADRAPWLAACGAAMAAAPEGLIVGCSSLKRSYRDIIRDAAAPARPVFAYLHGPRSLLAARLNARRDHFMPSTMLDSQLATLEIPQPEEAALIVSIDLSPEEAAQQIRRRLSL